MRVEENVFFIFFFVYFQITSRSPFILENIMKFCFWKTSKPTHNQSWKSYNLLYTHVREVLELDFNVIIRLKP